MRNLVKIVLYKLYDFLTGAVRKFIHWFHRVASDLKLKNIILFSSMPDFSDSSVEVFKLMVKMDEFKDYKFIWFCDYPEKLLKIPNTIIKKRIDNPLFRLVNLYYESTAKCCIYTHQLLGNMYNRKQLRVYIAHGSFGMKRHVASYNIQIDYSTHKIHTFMIYKNAVVCGLPRNDRLFDNSVETRVKLGIETYDKIIIWMPTFKHFQFKGAFHPPRNDFNTQKENDISLQADSAFFPEVEKTLKDCNTLLIIKYHPGQDLKYVSGRETANIKIITDDALSKLSVPLYSLLGTADALITDFSSVCYDFLLTNKPIGFDITDLELYKLFPKSSPATHMPGEKIQSVRDFCDFIMKVANGEDRFEKDRKKLLNKVHVHKDNRSAKRVVEFILSEGRGRGLFPSKAP